MGRFLVEKANYRRDIYMPDMFYGACYPPPKKYGFFHIVFDLFMIGITCGLWLIWIFVREMRNHNRY